MHSDTFSFFLYRLNKEYRYDLFKRKDRGDITDDDCLRSYLAQICTEQYDYKKATRASSYTWSLRNYQELSDGFSSLVLARSRLQKTTTIVTADSLTVGESVSFPPPADTIVLLIMWSRHIVIVENRAGMTTGETWLRNFDAIVDNAQLTVDAPIAPRLEPIPLRGTILEYLRSLDTIFRLRLRLKLPNPELSRWAERIYSEMVEGNLSEYLQEFVSPEGINVSEQSRAFSSAAMAELGYKEGSVQIDGEKDGKPVRLDEGKTAIKGKVDQLRSVIRGLETNASGSRLPNALRVLRSEVDRLFPNE